MPTFFASRPGRWTALLCAAVLAAGCTSVPPEDTIRQVLTERLPNLPKIDEVSKTPMEGLYEVRVNKTEIFYTDRAGNYLIQGELIDTKGRTNLTEARVEKLTALPFDSLPLKDASPSCAAPARASWPSLKTPTAASVSASSASWKNSMM